MEQKKTEQRPNKLRVTRARFVPLTMGLFVLLVIVIAFTAAALRQESGLALTGAALFLPWFYSLVMTLVLAFVHSRRASRACIRISPRELAAGEQAEAVYTEGDTGASAGKILQLPGILVRCRALLTTKDGRRISHDFNPNDNQSPHFFPVEKRGAYFSAYDEFAVFDIFGFFRFAFRLSAESNARLLASPHAAQEPVSVHARAGESNRQPEFSFQRTDNLIDHRPYIPGDDPRRINWKLYGHGGGLFVREGEREPPPHSNIAIMIDCEYDPSLYNNKDARRGIDVLCENALAAAQACTESGMDVLIGYTGSAGIKADADSAAPLLMPAKQSSALAWPAALPLSVSLELPAAPDDYSILILALPRSASNTALERFLKNTASRRAGKNNAIDLIFFCDNNNERFTAAETCCTLYRQRPGVTAKVVVCNNKKFTIHHSERFLTEAQSSRRTRRNAWNS